MRWRKRASNLPHLIVLDIMLPDIDGFEVCRILRTNIRTSHVPIIFLTQKDERSDKLQGLELGADDYITKPFDIEELKLRVQRAITPRRTAKPDRSALRSAAREADRRTAPRGSSGGRAGACWTCASMTIDAVSRSVWLCSRGRCAALHRHAAGRSGGRAGHANDFIGHAGGDNFIVITQETAAPNIRQALKNRFAEQVPPHYSFMDRSQGYVQMITPSGEAVKTPFMTLSVGMVSPRDYPFADIREITEQAAEARRKDY